jgi:hypothetical protein
MRYGLRLMAFVLAFPVVTHAAEAQRPGDGSGRGRALGPDGGAPQRRQQMEQQLRRGLWTIAKQRIGLTDEQMARLEQTNRRFDERRRALAMDERSQRLALREELMADARADQDRVAKALDRIQQIRRQRVDLEIEEQREFATFMTPVQRAKYAALQEQVRRRVEALRRQRPDSGNAFGRR